MRVTEGHLRGVVFAAALAAAAAGCSSDAGPQTGAPARSTGTSAAPAGQGVEGLAVGEDELEAFARQLVDDTGSTAAIVALVRGDGPPVVAVTGSAPSVDGVKPEPLAVDAPLHVSSITKSHVAALAVLLDDEGAIDLDAPIDRWVDWPGGDRLSLRQLLDNSSGLGTLGEDDVGSAFTGFVIRGEPVALDEVLAATRDTPPVAAPGEGTHYSNLNYVLAGGVLEAATGEDLGALLQSRLFEPLGLSDTWYPPAGPGDAVPAPGLYEVEPGTEPVATSALPMVAWQTVAAPAWGIVSTVPDLLTWSSVVLRDRSIGGMDLSSLSEIGPGGYGLGVIGVTADGDCVFDGCPAGAVFERLALNGDLPGSSTRILYDPATDVTLVVFLNRNALALDGPLIGFLDAALSGLAGSTTTSPP